MLRNDDKFTEGERANPLTVCVYSQSRKKHRGIIPGHLTASLIFHVFFPSASHFLPSDECESPFSVWCSLKYKLFLQSSYVIISWVSPSHLGVAQVSLVEGDPGQLVALADVKHRHRVASLQQLLHQVSAQEAGASDYCTTLITLETITQTLWQNIDIMFGRNVHNEKCLSSPVGRV